MVKSSVRFEQTETSRINKMASSQVEIASSSPFGCVLRDRNHRDGCRESNVNGTQNAFQRNIKSFVMGHINTCMSMSSDSATTNENNNNNNTNNKQCHMNNNNNNIERLSFARTNPIDINNNNNEASLASLMSPRHSQVLDQWAARQAREMVSTLENEVELLSMENNNNNNSNNNNNNNMSSTTSSSTFDESSSEVSSLGASSLVQLWEKRLNQSNSSKATSACTSTSNTEKTSPIGASATCSSENVFSAMEEQCLYGPLGNEESFLDWESDKTGHSDQSVSPHGRWYSSESDRVCVADIIKKLTATKQNQSGPPSFGDENEREECSGRSSMTGSPCRERECGGRCFTHEHSEHRAFPHAVTSSPRIRGRQAYNDLLMQMEHDRHGELKNLAQRGTVSKFTQRGRIQSLLRLRLLQRGVAANDPSRQKSMPSSEIHKPQGSAILQLRERFSTRVESRTTVQAEVASLRNPRREIVEIVNSTTQLDNIPSTDQLSKDTSSKTAHASANHSSKSTQNSVSQTTVDHNREAAQPSSDVMSQETSFREQHCDLQETAEATTSMTGSILNETADRVERSNQQNTMAKNETANEEEASNQQYAETSYQETAEEEEASIQNYAESSYDYTEEEEEDIDQSYDVTNYDWISEISRPRSYWEERRQAWYREMLDTDSHNEDIRKLLERRTVSTFLSSDFRERMDRLMESHRGTQTHLVHSQNNEEDSQGLIAFLQDHLLSASTPQEDGRETTGEEEERTNQDEDEEEEEEEEEEKEDEPEHEGESLISGSYHEGGDYSNQSSTWSYRDNEAGDDFDRVACTPSQPYQSPPFYQDSQRYSPSTNHRSIEVDLIYDLRGHMTQLYHEISELRKSIKGCMDMQMQLQQSMMNQEVHTVKKEEKKSHNRAPKKGNCCICYDMKVDSLLYRCGHMCTCLKCANELQWNSGKCPICRAKIVDVVRVYVD
ncbi:hypothetical protein VNO77_23560 [Canavalia gladiata]|uniref:RING-type domain-containing protein n=1 Tax=Canavalia gladiata TaxID=3824 RepID=A0AAN9L804_CANGL